MGMSCFLLSTPLSDTVTAGKSGALGHGDTAKRTVGRPVKALAGLTVHGAACGSDWMLVVAGWRPPAGKGGRCGGSGDHGKPAVPAAAYAPPPAGEDGGTLGGRFKYAEVEPPPSPRSPHQQRHNSQREAAAGVLSPGSTPSTPMAAHCHSGGGPDAAFAGSSGSGRLRGRSGREQRREERLEERQLGCSARRRSAALELPDDAPEAVASRRQRWMAEPPLAPSAFTPPDSECSSGDEGLPQEDRQMAYLLRRQIKVGRKGVRVVGEWRNSVGGMQCRQKVVDQLPWLPPIHLPLITPPHAGL